MSIVEPGPKNRRKRRFIYVAILVILGILAALLIRWFFGHPSYGTITVVPTPEKQEYGAPEYRKRYQGKYLIFTYPSDFRRREEVEAVKYPLLERIYLSRDDIEGRKIAITLQDNMGNSFEEYSSFRVRQNDKTVYSEEKIEKNGLDTVVFIKDTSIFEASAFFHRGNQVVAIAVSSPTTQDGLREELEELVDSFEWNGE